MTQQAYPDCKLINALDKSMRQPLLNRQVPPGLLLPARGLGARSLPLLLHISGLALGVQGASILQHTLCGVLTSVQEYILNHLQQLLINFGVQVSVNLYQQTNMSG